MENALNLKNEISNVREKWNERSSFTIRGVRNLSPSDLDVLEMYVDEFVNSGGFSFNGLAEPLGEVSEVLNKYNIKASY